jgi:uncharacterized membrane protein
MKELEAIFNIADGNKSGTVSREELSLVFDERVQSSPELLKMLYKILQKEGIDSKNVIISCSDMLLLLLYICCIIAIYVSSLSIYVCGFRVLGVCLIELREMMITNCLGRNSRNILLVQVLYI